MHTLLTSARISQSECLLRFLHAKRIELSMASPMFIMVLSWWDLRIACLSKFPRIVTVRDKEAYVGNILQSLALS